jgi:N-acetylglutamate synthase-like GNAT family acetyltransferase
MYVRDAKNREEVWLLDHLEELGLTDPAFRSRDYVVALDEETGTKTGFGRIRIHTGEDAEALELAAIGVPEAWRNRGVGAHVVERLVEKSRDQGFEVVYSLTSAGGYLTQFGFHRAEEDALPPAIADRLAEVREDDPDAVPMALDVADFEMPDRLRERFKRAGDDESETEPEPEETPEDFGIDPDEATYKYDTGR